MKSLLFALLNLTLIWISSCTAPKSEKAIEVKPEAQVQPKESLSKKSLYPRELREALFFAASLEREAIRLVTHQNSFESSTLFSVLSYAFETNSGTKKMAPSGLDCSRFNIEVKGNDFNISKTCVKPDALVVTLKSLNQKNDHYLVNFKIKEWASVVGLSVTLTNSDIQCEFQLKEKKFQSMTCQNWALAVASNSISATELKLSTFTFNRDLQNQLKLVGGFYRDLIERKKVEVIVPLQGKIKLFEKEIEVKDDFAEILKPSEETHGEKNENKSEVKNEVETKNEGDTKIEVETKIDEKSSQEEGQSPESQNHEGQNQNSVKDEDINQDQNNGGVPKSGPAPSGRRGR